MKTVTTTHIKAALKAKDISYAHVLLHSLAKIYNHTPYDVRYERLKPFAEQFPTLCVCCLKSCSQTGKKSFVRKPGLTEKRCQYDKSTLSTEFSTE